MSLFGVICETHAECFLRNPSSVPWTFTFFLPRSCCISVPTRTRGMWVLPTSPNWTEICHHLVLRILGVPSKLIWLLNKDLALQSLMLWNPAEVLPSKQKKSNFSLNGVLITVGNFSLLPIIYLQRIFLKGTILENSVWLWCLRK